MKNMLYGPPGLRFWGTWMFIEKNPMTEDELKDCDGVKKTLTNDSLHTKDGHGND